MTLQLSSMATHAHAARQDGRVAFLIAAPLLVPVLLAGALYLASWRPQHTVNHGQLLLPAHPFPVSSLVDWLGNPVKGSRISDTWVMLYVGTHECDARCRAQVHLMRQLQVAQNKAMRRIRRAVLVPDNAALSTYLRHAGPDIHAPDLLLLRPSPGTTLSPLLANSAESILLIDPLGNMMMRYPATIDGADISQDLERLLKYSWIG